MKNQDKRYQTEENQAEEHQGENIETNDHHDELNRTHHTNDSKQEQKTNEMNSVTITST